MRQIEPFGYVSDIWRRNSDVLGVESAFRIVEAVGVDEVAGLQPAHVRPYRGDRASAVRAEYQRKALASTRGPALPHVRVPGSDPPLPFREQALAASGSTAPRVRRSDQWRPRA